MESTEALRIIRALADGVNPFTGKSLDADSLYQNPQTVQALYGAIEALEWRQNRQERIARLPNNAGKPWSREEDQQLVDEFQNHMSFQRMAETHSRTVGAIKSRLMKKGFDSQ